MKTSGEHRQAPENRLRNGLAKQGLNKHRALAACNQVDKRKGTATADQANRDANPIQGSPHYSTGRPPYQGGYTMSILIHARAFEKVYRDKAKQSGKE